MESYLPISFLNDFIFCPRSIYFHQLYGKTSEYLWAGPEQTAGKVLHEAVDNKHYSSRKTVYQSMEIFSEKYNLCGKIDTFDETNSILRERKKKITVIYDGYIMQVYAQYHCLKEMGYIVKGIQFYSMDDNKIIPVSLPEDDSIMQNKFEELIISINSYNLYQIAEINQAKCNKCVYSSLCDVVV